MIRPLPARSLLAIAYMAGIFWLSSLPGRELASWGVSSALFDLAHMPLYAGLTLVTLWALVGPTGARALFVGALVMAFAASDEWHQHFVPGRVFSWADLAADALGVALGVAVREWVLPGVPIERGESGA
jgi:VanZ family protein